ncbi:hypothetical protein JZ751_029182, partial [Albula glossodonta]
AVTKPAVTCQIKNSTVTLRCAGDQSPLTQYSWVGPGIQNKPGSELQLNNEDIQNSTVYTCVVKNPVSQKRMEFPIKSCLAQGQSCVTFYNLGHPLLPSGVPRDEEIFSITWTGYTNLHRRGHSKSPSTSPFTHIYSPTINS